MRIFIFLQFLSYICSIGQSIILIKKLLVNKNIRKGLLPLMNLNNYSINGKTINNNTINDNTINDNTTNDKITRNKTTSGMDERFPRNYNDNNNNTLQKISEFLNKQRMLELLQSKNVSIVIKKEMSEQYLKNNSESSILAPNILKGILMSDW